MRLLVGLVLGLLLAVGATASLYQEGGDVLVIKDHDALKKVGAALVEFYAPWQVPLREALCWGLLPS